MEGAVSSLCERGLSDGICLPARGLDRTGSLLHSFPLPGIDLRVCRDPELPLVCARSAPCSAVWELRLWAPPSPSAGGFCFCGDAEVTGSFACAVKQVNNKAAASYTQGALIRDTLVAAGGEVWRGAPGRGQVPALLRWHSATVAGAQAVVAAALLVKVPELAGHTCG